MPYATQSQCQRRRLAALAVLALVVVASSGCAGGLVSRRITDEPGCAAEIVEDDLPLRRGIPVAVLPSFNMPRCFTRAGRQQWNDDIRDFLQPAPAPPLKPPHSRFHPLPTQPVFATRPEYAAPVSLDLPAIAGMQPVAEVPLAEEIPVPVAEELHSEPQPRPLPSPRSNVPPAEGEPAPQARPIPLPSNESKGGDASRGSIAPASFVRVVEPNPLRDGSDTATRPLRR